MTTAARPTFDPAKGGSGRGEKDLSAISRQYSSRDLPGHLKLKYRQPGQGTVEEVRAKDLHRELEEREKRPHSPNSPQSPSETNEDPAQKRLAIEDIQQVPANWDADDPSIVRDSDDEQEDGNGAKFAGSDDDDDVDEEMELLKAELDHIQKERAILEAKKEAERQQEEEKIRMENFYSGNPLLTKYSSSSSSSTASSKDDQPKVKRRWDDDVVFKNCAKSEPSKKSNTFINDSLRSEFHKKFMSKYIK